MVIKKQKVVTFSIQMEINILILLWVQVQIIGHNNELIRKTFQQVKKGTIYTIPNHYTDKVNKRLKKINPHFHNEYIFIIVGLNQI